MTLAIPHRDPGRILVDTPRHPGYRSYNGLPQLAGLCTVEDAARPGLLIEECVRRLKRFHFAFRRLHHLLTARITAEPIYELKTAFSHHAYLFAEHAAALRTRVGEMREPPLGLEDVPHPALDVFFDEVLAAPNSTELVAGAYRVGLRQLAAAMRKYGDDTNPLTDAPSRRVLRFALLEAADLESWADQALNCLPQLPFHSEKGAGSDFLQAEKEKTLTPDPSPRGQRGVTQPGSDEAKRLAEWESYLAGLLDAAGGMDGTATPSSDGTAARRYSTTPFKYDPVPRRDERFTDPWNQGVNAESFLYNPAYPARAKALMMLYKRLREIDVPEMMASIIVQTTGKPWGYYRDMSRQLWDEARHAMMGEVGFVALGVDWRQVKVTFNWSYRLNTECTPIERHGVLYFIEQGLMPRTGKRFEFETAQAAGLPLLATLQDFDWADEVLHSQIGRLWYVPEFGTLQKALEFGDRAWSKVLSNWTTVKDQGLTRHDNWWPAVYSQACAAAGVAPDPEVLAFNETYEGKRADLQRVAAE